LEQLKDIYQMKRFVYKWILSIALLLGIHTLAQNMDTESIEPGWTRLVRDLIENSNIFLTGKIMIRDERNPDIKYQYEYPAKQTNGKTLEGKLFS